MISAQFLKFLVASGVAAAANLGSRIAFDIVLPYEAAIVLAFLVGLSTAFALNRVYVFPSGSGSIARQAAWFVAVNLFALVQTLLVSLVLARWLLPRIGWTWHAQTVAHAAGIVVPIFSSYIGHRVLTFRR